MHHLSSHVATRKMVHSILDKTPASLRTRTLKMAKKALKGIPLKAFFGHFSGSSSPRCGGLIKNAMHHLSSHVATRKMCIGCFLRLPHSGAQGTPKLAEITKILKISDLRISAKSTQIACFTNRRYGYSNRSENFQNRVCGSN